MGCFLTWLWSEPDAVTFVCSLLQHWAKLSYKLLFSYFHISAHSTMFKSVVYKNLTAEFQFTRHTQVKHSACFTAPCWSTELLSINATQQIYWIGSFADYQQTKADSKHSEADIGSNVSK